MTRPPISRLIALLGLSVAIAISACSANESGVVTGRADTIPGATNEPTVPATTLPTATAPKTTVPTTTVPATEPEPAPTTAASVPAAEPAEFGTGLGDVLFPELGAPGVDVLRYDVRLDVDVEAGAFDATVDIEVDVEPGFDQLVLDARDFDVGAVLIDGVDASFEQTTDELLIDLPPSRGSVVTATISYLATPDGGRSAVGLPAGWFPTGTGSYVLNEPDGARTWLPSNDHPSDKATWRFEITAPAARTVSANGTLVRRGGGDQAWVWESSEPMTTYLVHLVIGDYDLVEPGAIDLDSGRALPITHLVPTGTAADFEIYFAQVQPQLAFFEARFGPYPGDEYGLAFVDSPPGLAMETQGRSLFSSRDFASGELGFLQHLLLAHELAHEWFGNTVSPATWSDLWLNESFATYAQWLWLDEAEVMALDRQAATALQQRQNGTEATGTPEVSNLFGFESYDGGAVVVHALRLELGDDVFFRLLQDWLADNADTSQSTAAFIDLAQRESGRDLAAFFDDWLYATDLPDEFPG